MAFSCYYLVLTSFIISEVAGRARIVRTTTAASSQQLTPTLVTVTAAKPTRNESRSRQILGGSDDLIVGGRVARPGEFPWMVSLAWEGGDHFCGGSLLTLKHILTACHCVCRYKDEIDEEIISVEDFTLSAGSLFSLAASGNSPIQVRLPEHIGIHPLCRSRRRGGYLFDYAIVRTDAPFEASNSVQVMKLISLDEGASWKYLVDLVKNRRWCKVVGWGTTAINNRGNYVNVSDTLRVVGVQLISFAKCQELLRNFSSSYKGLDVQARYQVCAKNNNESDACRGDSGGGFVCGTYIFGLLSWGPACGEKDTPSMYAAIDGGWDFIVKSIVSVSSTLYSSSVYLLVICVSVINYIRNI